MLNQQAVENLSQWSWDPSLVPSGDRGQGGGLCFLQMPKTVKTGTNVEYGHLLVVEAWKPFTALSCLWATAPSSKELQASVIVPAGVYLLCALDNSMEQVISLPGA